MRETQVTTSVAKRMSAALFGQRERSLPCPDTPRLDGRVALITGPTSGIGLTTALGLLDRGAHVLLAARDLDKAARLQAQLAGDGERLRRVTVVTLDLADLASVPTATRQAMEILGDRRIDILVENAGVWPQRYATTAQGLEVAFGTNVLGHFAFRRALMTAGLLAADARVLVLTGDIYIMEQDCTTDFAYRGVLGCMHAYCRSKLGNLWIARELQRRHPQLQVHVVHPGVVDSGLSQMAGPMKWLQARLMLDTDAGAQTSLLCATQPGLEPGGYYHNTQGLMRLAADDPALNDVRAKALWDECERLTATG